MPLFQNAEFFISAHQLRDLPPATGIEIAFAGRSNAGKSSAINALAFFHYAKVTGDSSYLERARTVLWGNLSLFTPEGTGSAAHLYPFSTNGVRGERNDPWANDQDWALIYLLMTRDTTGNPSTK